MPSPRPERTRWLAVQTDYEIAADGNGVTAALIFQPLKIIMVLLCRRPTICHIVNHDPVDDRDIVPGLEYRLTVRSCSSTQFGISIVDGSISLRIIFPRSVQPVPAPRRKISRHKSSRIITRRFFCCLVLLPADCRLPAGCTPLPATRSAPRLILFPQTQTVFSSVLHIYHSP